MLKGKLSKKGYDWWWHNFTAYHKETGEAKAFFIEYFICNPALGGSRAILGQQVENKSRGVKPSYALVKVGVWGKGAKQIHNFYPISEFSCPPNELNVKIGNCLLTETEMKGSCELSAKDAASHSEYMCDAGSMKWDVKIHKIIAYNVGYGASKIFRAINAFEMYWHAEGIKTEYSGEIIIDGEPYVVIPEKSYGYADKNWGGNFTSPWLWISSCCMKSLKTGITLRNSAVELGGGRPKVFGVALDRKLLGGMYYEGKMYDYNFSRFWTGAKIDFLFEEGEKLNVWKVHAKNRHSIMELTLYCPKDEMLLINYEAPNGEKLHNRLWNGGTGYGTIKLYEKQRSKTILIDEIEMKQVGCEYGEYC